MEEDEELAFKIHGLLLSDSDSDHESKDTFDEEYFLLKPPPVVYDPSKIVKISAKKVPLLDNIWEKRLNVNADKQPRTNKVTVNKKNTKLQDLHFVGNANEAREDPSEAVKIICKETPDIFNIWEQRLSNINENLQENVVVKKKKKTTRSKRTGVVSKAEVQAGKVASKKISNLTNISKQTLTNNATKNQQEKSIKKKKEKKAKPERLALNGTVKNAVKDETVITKIFGNLLSPIVWPPLQTNTNKKPKNYNNKAIFISSPGKTKVELTSGTCENNTPQKKKKKKFMPLEITEDLDGLPPETKTITNKNEKRVSIIEDDVSHNTKRKNDVKKEETEVKINKIKKNQKKKSTILGSNFTLCSTFVSNDNTNISGYKTESENEFHVSPITKQFQLNSSFGGKNEKTGKNADDICINFVQYFEQNDSIMKKSDYLLKDSLSSNETCQSEVIIKTSERKQLNLPTGNNKSQSLENNVSKICPVPKAALVDNVFNQTRQITKSKEKIKTENHLQHSSKLSLHKNINKLNLKPDKQKSSKKKCKNKNLLKSGIDYIEQSSKKEPNDIYNVLENNRKQIDGLTEEMIKKNILLQNEKEAQMYNKSINKFKKTDSTKTNKTGNKISGNNTTNKVGDILMPVSSRDAIAPTGLIQTIDSTSIVVSSEPEFNHEINNAVDNSTLYTECEFNQDLKEENNLKNYDFGEDFQQFIKSLDLTEQDNFNILSSFTYEQIYRSYKVYESKSQTSNKNNHCEFYKLNSHESRDFQKNCHPELLTEPSKFSDQQNKTGDNILPTTDCVNNYTNNAKDCKNNFTPEQNIRIPNMEEINDFLEIEAGSNDNVLNQKKKKKTKKHKKQKNSIKMEDKKIINLSREIKCYHYEFCGDNFQNTSLAEAPKISKNMQKNITCKDVLQERENTKDFEDFTESGINTVDLIRKNDFVLNNPSYEQSDPVYQKINACNVEKLNDLENQITTKWNKNKQNKIKQKNKRKEKQAGEQENRLFVHLKEDVKCHYYEFCDENFANFEEFRETYLYKSLTEKPKSEKNYVSNDHVLCTQEHEKLVCTEFKDFSKNINLINVYNLKVLKGFKYGQTCSGYQTMCGSKTDKLNKFIIEIAKKIKKNEKQQNKRKKNIQAQKQRSAFAINLHQDFINFREKYFYKTLSEPSKKKTNDQKYATVNVLQMDGCDKIDCVQFAKSQNSELFDNNPSLLAAQLIHLTLIFAMVYITVSMIQNVWLWCTENLFSICLILIIFLFIMFDKGN